jgi:LPS sulfotransferase NodH
MNVFLLSAIRSGSTYLINMLGDTGLFHYPEAHSGHKSLVPQRKIREFLAPNHHVDPWWLNGRETPANRQESISYLRHKVSFMTEQPCLFKILMEQYQYYLLDHNDRSLMESLFPDLKYIWLERSDIIARTVSAYIFFRSKIDHIYDQKSYDAYMDEAVHLDKEGLLDVYKNHVKRCDWAKYLNGVNYLKVDYDDLVARPQETLKECLDYLGLAYNHIDLQAIVDRHPKFKTERPESAAWKDTLRALLRRQTL